jgi:hypothetical protein
MVILAGGFAFSATAQTVIFGGPTWDPISDTGYLTGFAHRSAGNGVAAGSADRYDDGFYQRTCAVRWDISGSPLVELGNLGGLYSIAMSANAAGTAVGYSERYDAAGNFLGSRPVRWNASGTAAIEMANLGTSSSGFAAGAAWCINNSGMAAGAIRKFELGVDKGGRAVRWNASGTVATELGNLGLSSDGLTDNYASDISAVGTAVGIALKYDAGIYKGERAVRWDASSTAATELGNLGTNRNGETTTHVNAINTRGTSVGWAWKHDAAGDYTGANVAVRWDASGTAATELGNLDIDSSPTHYTTAYAYDINDSGAAVGMAVKYDNAGINEGSRPVRWDPSSTAAIELGLLGTDLYGLQEGHAGAINAAGIAVGDVSYIRPDGASDQRAVAWGPDGAVIDLNTLIDPSSGWLKLITTDAISDTNWVTGVGAFQANGDYYYRPFLLNISSAVPEPAGMFLVVLATPALVRRRKRVAAHR